MKVVILAGGLGTRLQEETALRPKPMVEIGNEPILWHIMKIYNSQGFDDFGIALGYKGEVVKEYFLNYRYRTGSLTIKPRSGEVLMRDDNCEDWTIDLLETGLHTQTGGRVKRVARSLGPVPFMLTYGDGVANVNLPELLAFHKACGRLATVTAVRPPARFGAIGFEGNQVATFREKPQLNEGWINGGFFVLEPEVAEYIAGDETVFEREPLERLAADGQLAAYRHEGFWHCMDTLRDVQFLNGLWQSGEAPWKVWD